MIDTDKYEGHAEGPWWCNEDDWRCIDTMIKHEKGEDLEEICRVFYREVDYNGKPLPNGTVGFNKATARLIADAPLLLAEVKRLREENEILREELKNDDTGIKAIDGLLKAVGDRNEEVKRLREQLEMWKRWFNQGADNKMEDGDAFDIIFHDDECPMGDNCDGECWNCETKKLKEMIE